MPRLESDLNASRTALDQERAAKVSAEQIAAVATAKLDAEIKHAQELVERLAKAESINVKNQDKLEAASQKTAVLEERLQLANGKKSSLVAELERAKKVVETFEKEKAAAVMEKRKPGRPKKSVPVPESDSASTEKIE